MKNVRTLVIALFAAGLAYTLAREVTRPNPSGTPTPAQVATAEQKLADTIAELKAKSRAPDGSIDQERYAEEGKKKQAESLKNARNASTRNAGAAGQAYGYLLRNTVGYTDWCAKHGVDLTPYAQAFRNYNRAPIAKMELVFAREKFDLSPFREMLLRQFPALIDDEFSPVMKQNNLTGKELCMHLNESREEMVVGTAMKEYVPAAYELLMAYN